VPEWDLSHGNFEAGRLIYYSIKALRACPSSRLQFVSHGAEVADFYAFTQVKTHLQTDLHKTKYSGQKNCTHIWTRDGRVLIASVTECNIVELKISKWLLYKNKILITRFYFFIILKVLSVTEDCVGV
jgi:hypothetical protein